MQTTGLMDSTYFISLIIFTRGEMNRKINAHSCSFSLSFFRTRVRNAANAQILLLFVQSVDSLMLVSVYALLTGGYYFYTFN